MAAGPRISAVRLSSLGAEVSFAAARPLEVVAVAYDRCGVRAGIAQQPVACRPGRACGGDHCPLGRDRCMIDIRSEAVLWAVGQAA